MPPPVYIVKPKNIFKHPFIKFDLDKVINREAQNDDITDYFNYGFNEDTMNIYGKLVKREIQVLDESTNPTYFDAPSELMRLNDEIPMDFGGFCKFFDPTIFVNLEGKQQQIEYMSDFHNGERLFKNFIISGYQKQSPLTDFVKSMYKVEDEEPNWIINIMDQIQINLQRKYQEMMKKIIQKQNNPTGNDNHGDNHGSSWKNRKDHDKGYSHKVKKQEQVKDQEKMEEQQSSVESSSSSSDSDSDSKDDRKKKSKDNKDKDRHGRSRSRSRSSRKDKKNKHKGIKKQDRSHKTKDRKKSKDRKREKERSRKYSRDRDRSRSKKKDKSKKRRN